MYRGVDKEDLHMYKGIYFFNSALKKNKTMPFEVA